VGFVVEVSLVPLIAGILVLIASIISLKLGISVAIVEILLGVIVGNFGLQPEAWMTYLAGFGGIILTFLAGAEVDIKLMREHFKESILLGGMSFLVPFLIIFLFVYLVIGWTLNASLLAGVALATASLAVVYSVLVESNLSKTQLGKMMMAVTFVTDSLSALALSILFLTPDLLTLIFVVVSIIIMFIAVKFSHKIFDNPKYKNKMVEPEIKYIFLLLLTLIYFGGLGHSQAVLPAFILGLLMSRHFAETSETKTVRNRLRTVAYAIITPFFFLVGGMNISLPLVLTAFEIFVTLFLLKIFSKFIGVYFLSKKYLKKNHMYFTLLMSTGLTMGTIASFFGLQTGIINQTQFSVIIGVVIASAIIPTFFAQKWFKPITEEDIIENQNGY